MTGNCTHSEHDGKGPLCKLLRSGAPGEIRTPDLQLRRLPLYPAELRARYVQFTAGASSYQCGRASRKQRVRSR